ncbi:MAG: hypothetical protein M3X11_04260, partial [Acidobacteriota bacterium]|nr:hypothetical protein [Acidobacteriota bacterium]
MNCTVARSLFALLLLSLSAAQAAAQSPPSNSSTPPEQGIPLPEIITRAEQIKRPLREIAARITSNSEKAEIADRLPVGEAQLPAQARQVEERIATAPTLYELRELERDWRQRGVELDNWQKTLAQAGAQAESDLRWLRHEHLRWKQTLNSIDDPDLLETVFQRIRDVLDESQRLQNVAEERLNLLLSLQDRVSQQDLLVASVTDQIARAKQRFQGQLLARDNRPLWTALLHPRERAVAGTLPEQVSEPFVHELAAARESLKSQAQTIALLFLLFGAVFWGNIVLARKIDPLTADDDRLHQSARVLKQPGSVALLITLLTYLWLSPHSASIVNSIAALLLLIPFLRVARLLVEPPAWLRVPLYILA